MDISWQWAGNRWRIYQRDKKKGAVVGKSTSSTKYVTIKCDFSHSPLCIRCTSIVFLLLSAVVRVLQSTKEVWGTSLFFRPQHCRCQWWLPRVCFLSRQQIQHQADAEGLRDTGCSQAAVQQRTDTVVCQQISALQIIVPQGEKHLQVLSTPARQVKFFHLNEIVTLNADKSFYKTSIFSAVHANILYTYSTWCRLYILWALSWNSIHYIQIFMSLF